MGRNSRLVSGGLTAGAIALIALAVGACNEHSVELVETDHAVEVVESHQAAAAEELDLLWTIDNSGSMCRSQEILREGIDRFIDELEQVNVDFHIGVTTTHMIPEEQTFIEPIARPGHLQSTAQPLPGIAEDACQFSLFTPDDLEDNPDAELGDIDYRHVDPVLDQLEAGIECTEDPDEWDHLLEDFDADEFRCTQNARTPDCDDEGIPDDADYCLCPDDDADYPNCLDCDQYKDEDGDKPRMEAMFPDQDAMRDVPLVLRSEDYEREDGTLDTERLRNDFGCMSMVGTRGSGFEQGLAGATTAVSPQLTGGADEDIGELHENPDEFRDEYPNAGFLRPGANTGVIFVSDENDCSYDPEKWDDVQELNAASEPRRQCGVTECTIQEHRLKRQSDIPDDDYPDSAILPVDELADDFLLNTVQSRGIELDDYYEPENEQEGQEDQDPDLTREDKVDLAWENFSETILPASIHGAYQALDDLEERIGDDIPDVCPTEPPEWVDQYFRRGTFNWLVPPSCRGVIGVAWSGHRYEEFLRHFDTFFPRPDEDNPEEPLDGEICDDFTDILREIGEFLAPEPAGCVDEIYECAGPDDACPDDPIDGEPGSCTTYPGVDPDDEDAEFYCDTGIEVRLQYDLERDLTREDLEATDYCIEDTFGPAPFQQSCVVDPARYEWNPCPTTRNAKQLAWSDDDWVQVIGDFEVIVRYANLTGGADDEPTAQNDGDQNDDNNQADEG